ncbi:MAG: tagaturonate epimerase family protein [Negativicutes bacterium]|nr:tagaturonate epimerase family protein [Negativicutes bacterium]
MLTTLALLPSFGFGDRLGLATAGHIAAVKDTKFAPIFAQQSVRENARTGRTPQQVLDDAKRAVDAAGWEAPWGADADHLKTVDDLPAFVQAGYTFFTVDPGAYVDNGADTESIPILLEKARKQNWDEVSALYLSQNGDIGFGEFDPGTLARAVVKYGRAIQQIVGMYRRLAELKESFDFEVSVDETDSPTTALEHYFIASELNRLGVRFTSLAPRFIGRFEKGVDYIGDLSALDAELARHAAVTAHFGTYKLSLHSGSDKFSVYPLIVKHWGSRLHVKTAGTSYLEGLRVLAVTNPALFQRIWALGLERYPTDRASYHVSADVNKVPGGIELPALLDDFNAREILHVTFGSALIQFGTEIKAELVKHSDKYNANLLKHFRKHLDLLK